MNIWNHYINIMERENMLWDNMPEMLRLLLKDKEQPGSVQMAVEIIKTKIIEIIKHDLTEEQGVVFDALCEYVETNENNYEAIVINGFAGTGKTYLIKTFANYARCCLNKKIAITAPTNKAVKVLNDGTGRIFIEDEKKLTEDICYSTIHKLLNMKEIIDDDGNISFQPFAGSNISYYNLIIIDEMSMVNKDIAKLIVEKSKGKKLIMLGDPCQIPPIKEKESCLFDYPDLKKKVYVLDKIIRQKEGNPIIEGSIHIREHMSDNDPIIRKNEFTSKGSVNFLEDSKKAREIITNFLLTDYFKENHSFFKMIAWRNSSVDSLNNFARKILFCFPRKYEIGEIIIANKPVYNSGTQVMCTSEEMKITGIEEKEEKRILWSKAYGKRIETNFKYYKINGVNDEGKNIYFTKIHDDSLNEFLKLCYGIKAKAIKDKNSEMWVEYYSITKWNPDIDYAYAITCHKSQGSTYENVLLCDKDIALNKNLIERNKIRYTSYTRARKNLFIL